MSKTVSREQRFTKAHPCPICQGYDQEPRGQRVRCWGFLSSDGAYAHCSRDEYAGTLPLEEASLTYAHRLTGDCRCGDRHGPRADDRASRNGHQGKRITATYDYVDEQGRLLYQAVRYQPKSFSQRRPDGQGGWIYNLDGVRRVLYRLPEVLEAIANDRLVCIAEGEADVEALWQHGYPATTNPMGAKKWRDDYSQMLKDATDVVIFGDHDAEGRAHVRQVTQSLRKVIGLTPRIAELDGLPEHGDLRDWLTMHGQEDLDHLIAEAKPAPDAAEAHGRHEERPAARPLIVHAHEVQAQAIEWIWEPYIPRSMLVMLDGDPGLGKSMMLLQAATNLSKGLPFLDQFGKPTRSPDVDGPQTTLILSAEDSLSHVMIPRLKRAGADLTRIKFLQGWLGPEDEEHAFDLQHLEVLIQAIEEVKPVLVILDPLVAYLGDIDMHRSNETRPLMAALGKIAERYACTVLGVRHPSKLDLGGRLMYRGQGNLDLIGAARSGLWVQPHPAHPETETIMIQSKTNVGALGRTVVFSREQGEFAWKGVSRLTEAMVTGKGPDPWSLLEAFFWLEEQMTPGIPYPSDKLEKDGLEREINERTLRRAKKLLNIRSTKQGDQWYSILPSL
jgi:putative DNA primase/helicase